MAISRSRSLTLSLFLVLSLAPLRARPGEPPPSSRAREIFLNASEGGGSPARAEAQLRKLLAEQPQDPVVLAYAGAAATLVGRDARSPIDSMRQTEAGLDQLDQALRKLGPEHDRQQPGGLPPRLETLLVAASTFAQVPDSVFHRVRDAKAAMSAALSDRGFQWLPPPVQARFHWIAAQIAKAEHGAAAERAALEQVIALDPSGPFAGQAQIRLAELSR